MQFKTLILSLALTAVASPSALSANEWAIDTMHSGAQFRIRHMMVSTVNGSISGAKGNITYDGKVKNLQVTADLDPKTINTNEADRDKHLKNADFFDVEKFPAMSFKSKKVVAAGKDYKLVGDLTMHGVTKEVSLDLQQPSPILKDKKGKEHVGTTATGKINRKDFGLNYNKQLDQGGLALGELVDITLDIEAERPAVVASADAKGKTVAPKATAAKTEAPKKK